MNLSDFNTCVIIDFDSTFVKLEGLEELAKISLSENPKKDKIIAEIEKITNEGMTGKISFEESLDARLKLFQPNRSHISKLVKLLEDNITTSIKKNLSFFLDNSTNIYVISGGFEEWIYPVVLPFGIKSENIISNKFLYDNSGNIIGADKSIPLTRSEGKSKCVKNLNLSCKKVMIGDGYTDYEVKKNGKVNNFVLFTENILRKDLVQFADHISNDWDDVIDFLETNS